MSTQHSSYVTQMHEHSLVTEVTEVLQPVEINNSPSQYKPLSGMGKWIRYGWYPSINIISLIGAIVAIASFLNQGISRVDLGILFFMFNFIGLGGEAGMHRLFVHKSYKVSKPLRILLALAGSMLGEAPIVEYAAYHRCHHLYTDREGDLHSPHYFEAKKPWAKLRNVWHAFFGWRYTLIPTKFLPPNDMPGTYWLNKK